MSENKVLATYFGDANEVTWKDEEEKGLFWFYDDLHCPNPISPLYFDVGGWWGQSCEYMYRRFGAPIGSEWIAKKIGGYVYSAVVPPKTAPDKVNALFAYYSQVMPIYADTFLDRWNKEYIPELEAAGKKIVDFDFKNSSIPECLIHMEDCLDLQDRAFRIHWIINLAQFQASSAFSAAAAEAGADNELIGKINVSKNDRNWDSLKALWEMKEYVLQTPSLKAVFTGSDAKAVMEKLPSVENGNELIAKVDKYKNEYGYKSNYTHEYIYTTWFEDPTPIYNAILTYVGSNYDFYADYNKCMEDQTEAIEKLYSMVKDPEKLAALKTSLELSVKMAPITPNHHFYIDQGIYARMRLMFKAIGEKFAEVGILDDAEDIFMLEYEEIRCAGAAQADYPVKDLVKQRRADMDAAAKCHPRLWYGTATQWQVYEEPYKTLWGYPDVYEANQAEEKAAAAGAASDATVIKGIPGSPGVKEGVARFVTDPAEFDFIQSGEILICKMTNPAWVVTFSNISALVTDTGGALSHPAVVAREFGIPCVVGTRKATQLIKTGDKVRVNGTKGTVEIIG